MTIVRYDPWTAMSQLQDELNRAFSRVASSEEDSGSIATSDWAPAVDIKEDDSGFVLHADIPGVDPKDIEVSMDNGMLTIRGERHVEKEEEKEGYKRIERSRGTFYRRFALIKSPILKLRRLRNMIPAMALPTKVVDDKAMVADKTIPIRLSNCPRVESLKGNTTITNNTPIKAITNLISCRR